MHQLRNGNAITANPHCSYARLRQDLISYIGEAHGVRSPRVDVHRSLSTDGLHQRLLRCGHLAKVDRNKFELNWNGARVVGWRTSGIAAYPCKRRDPSQCHQSPPACSAVRLRTTTIKANRRYDPGEATSPRNPRSAHSIVSSPCMRSARRKAIVATLATSSFLTFNSTHRSQSSGRIAPGNMGR